MMKERHKSSSVTLNTPKREIVTESSTIPRKSVKRAITSPVLVQFTHPSKKTIAKSDSSVSEKSDISDLSIMTEEAMVMSGVEAFQLVSVTMQPDGISVAQQQE